MTLSNDWQTVSKRWGHPFHAMCSYLAMFPPRLPHYFIEKFTRPGDAVLDPFCGRGTTPFQACVTGRIGIGIDLNPLAYTLTRAKVNAPDFKQIHLRLRALENDMFYGDIADEPPHVQMLFHPATLRQLVYLKQVLDLGDPCDNFIAATILGIMHGAGSRRRQRTAFLSLSMPNSFSLSPDRLRRYIRAKRLKQTPVNVFSAVRLRLQHLFACAPPQTAGAAFLENVDNLAQIAHPAIRKRRVQLVFTAPPHFHTVRYGLYNSVRLWFLNEDYEALDRRLTQYHCMDEYKIFLCRALSRIYSVLAPGGVCCMVVGDITDRKTGRVVSLADELWKMLCAQHSRFKLYTILPDHSDKAPPNSGLTRSDTPHTSLDDRILVLYRETIEEVTDEVDWTPPRRSRAARDAQRRLERQLRLQL
ncbi:MAG: site-specific DNA-methyltransferase [Candidatus Sumerlaeia bacterium]|nr:site-specific DNA-methyltransferase [Candidatus Sumerlaeia bacterium]